MKLSLRNKDEKKKKTFFKSPICEISENVIPVLRFRSRERERVRKKNKVERERERERERE